MRRTIFFILILILTSAATYAQTFRGGVFPPLPSPYFSPLSPRISPCSDDRLGRTTGADCRHRQFCLRGYGRSVNREMHLYPRKRELVLGFFSDISATLLSDKSFKQPFVSFISGKHTHKGKQTFACTLRYVCVTMIALFGKRDFLRIDDNHMA